MKFGESQKLYAHFQLCSAVSFRSQLALGKLEPPYTTIAEAPKANPVTQITDDNCSVIHAVTDTQVLNQEQRDGPCVKAQGRLPRGRDN